MDLDQDQNDSFSFEEQENALLLSKLDARIQELEIVRERVKKRMQKISEKRKDLQEGFVEAVKNKREQWWKDTIKQMIREIKISCGGLNLKGETCSDVYGYNNSEELIEYIRETCSDVYGYKVG